MKFTTFHLVTALSRNALEWLYDPRIRAHVLESRAGRLYRAYFDGRGWWLNPLRNVARHAEGLRVASLEPLLGVDPHEAAPESQNRSQELCPAL